MNKYAIFTMAQNDDPFLEVWLSYYSSAAPDADLYVLDHNSEGDHGRNLGELTKMYPFHRMQVHEPTSFNSVWMTNVVRSFQAFLLQSYNIVAFSGVDEIIAPHWDLSLTLQEWLAYFGNRDDLQTRCQGYEVVHDVESEPPIVWDQEVLSQRSHWYFCHRYSKPLVSKITTWWHPGFHEASNVPKQPSTDVILIHLHKIDYELCRARHQERVAREWHAPERLQGVYRHNMIDDPDKLSRWIRTNADDTSEYARLDHIPPQIRQLI